MLIDFAIATLESAFSYAVTHQITQHKQWQKLYNKPILLRLENPDLKLYCIIKESAVTLRQAQDNETVSVSITTNYHTLLQILRGQHSNQSITIQGQSQIANLLARYIKKFRPDVEGMLATIIGDGPAYAVTTQVGKAAKKLQKNFDNLHYSAGEYLSHECQLTPSKRELKKLYKDIDQFSSKVDLLASKVNQLHQHGSQLNDD